MGNKEKKIAELKSKKKGDIIVAAVFQLFPLLSIFFIAVGVINRGETVNTIICLVLGFLPAEVIAFLLILNAKKCSKLIAEEEARPSEPPAEFAKTLYNNDGYTYNTAREFYLAQTGRNPKKLTRMMLRRLQKNILMPNFTDFRSALRIMMLLRFK